MSVWGGGDSDRTRTTISSSKCSRGATKATNLRIGPVDERELAVSLSEWTTVQHRANIAHSIVYHAREIPPNLSEAIAEADEFISRIATLLAATPPQPYRNPPVLGRGNREQSTLTDRAGTE